MESLRLKRMISKYSYCIDEFNETEFLFKEYSSNFNKEFNIPVPEQVITEQSEEMETKVENKSDLVNKLYRKLARITHPDKGGSMEVFQLVNLEYSNGNVLGLLVLANKFGVSVPDLSTYTESDFNVDIQVLSDRTSRIKSSLAWAWQEADPERKKELQQRFNF